MKKIIIALCFFLTINIAHADICYDIDEKTIQKATEILKTQKEIFSYCSICSNAEPERITINKIKSGNPILINDNGIDLAHVYYKNGNSFINLGIAANCIPANEYGIKATLPDLPIIHHTIESDKLKAKKQAKYIFDTCLTQNNNDNEHMTTADMVAQNTLINDCLEQAIKQEIDKGFEQEYQTEMYQYVENARKNIYKFYLNFYDANKYCAPYCGTISVLLPYNNESIFLVNILEDLLYLNISKDKM